MSKETAPHEAGGTADGVVEEAPRFSDPEKALANVAKVAVLLSRAQGQVDHLTDRLATAQQEAVAAGADPAAARAAADTTSEGDPR